MRQSNATLISNAVDAAADVILEEVFSALKENGIGIGLKLKREILERVEKKIAGPVGIAKEG